MTYTNVRANLIPIKAKQHSYPKSGYVCIRVLADQLAIGGISLHHDFHGSPCEVEKTWAKLPIIPESKNVIG